MEKAAKLNVPVSLHEEDPSFIRNNGISHGNVSDALASTVLLPLQKNLWLQETACWH